jgi:hypothetical protein
MQLVRLTTVAAALVLAVAISSPTFAAKKKAAPAAAQPNGLLCIQPSGPVCGVKAGQKFTYANSCFAQKDGAKVASQGACKAAKSGKKAAKTAKKGGTQAAAKKKTK